MKSVAIVWFGGWCWRRRGGLGVGGGYFAVKDGSAMVGWCWRRREMEGCPMVAPWNNECICGLWLRTVILWGDFVLICHACMAVVWAFFLYDGLWPLFQIRRLFFQVVGVLCIWDVLTGFACFWGVLVDVSLCEVVNCGVWCCAFLAVARFPCEREFMLFCYTMIWWYFMLLGPLRDFPMSCHAFRPWCHEISSWHLMLCLTPNEIVMLLPNEMLCCFCCTIFG